MATESLTYAALGRRLGVSHHAARALARRLRLPRQKANDGRVMIMVDMAEIEHKPKPAAARSPADDHPAVAVLIEELKTQLAAERTRCDHLIAELIALRAPPVKTWWRWSKSA